MRLQQAFILKVQGAAAESLSGENSALYFSAIHEAAFGGMWHVSIKIQQDRTRRH